MRYFDVGYSSQNKIRKLEEDKNNLKSIVDEQMGY
jgi:hypothetical protein